MDDNQKKLSGIQTELEKGLDEVAKAHEGLQPYYLSEIDGAIDDGIKPNVSGNNFKFFEAVRFKVKALWYIQQNVIKWDEKYKNFVSICLDKKNFRDFNEPKVESPFKYHYFPFFEAIEFENLLFQGKSCLDSFSKAVGCYFKVMPNNLEGLENTLKNNFSDDSRAIRILEIIKEQERLKGTVLNPKKDKKKSIRDVITHAEHVNIYFGVSQNENSEYSMSEGALFRFRHPEIVLLSNYLVKNISSNIWYYTLNIVRESFGVLADK